MAADTVIKWILNAFELAAGCTGIFFYRKWRNTCWIWFSIFLLFIFATEITAKYCYNHIPLKSYNPAIYRYINIPAGILFYQWLLAKPFRGKKLFNLQLFFGAGYILLFMLEEFALPPYYKKFGSVSFQFGAIGILILSLKYFVQLLHADKILYYKQDIHFWVSAGIIIYTIITLPLNAMRNTLFLQYHSIAMAYWYITFFFNYIMYTFFILGFIWGKPRS